MTVLYNIVVTRVRAAKLNPQELAELIEVGTEVQRGRDGWSYVIREKLTFNNVELSRYTPSIFSTADDARYTYSFTTPEGEKYKLFTSGPASIDGAGIRIEGWTTEENRFRYLYEHWVLATVSSTPGG